MIFFNFMKTPVMLNDGSVFPSNGETLELRINSHNVIRKTNSLITFFEEDFNIRGLPEKRFGTYYIVPNEIRMMAKLSGRKDFVSPALNHPDVVKDKEGNVISVPGFVR